MRGRNVLLTTNYRIPAPTLAMVYLPYVADLRAAVHRLAAVGVEAKPQTTLSRWIVLARTLVRNVRSHLVGQMTMRWIRL